MNSRLRSLLQTFDRIGTTALFTSCVWRRVQAISTISDQSEVWDLTDCGGASIGSPSPTAKGLEESRTSLRQIEGLDMVGEEVGEAGGDDMEAVDISSREADF